MDSRVSVLSDDSADLLPRLIAEATGALRSPSPAAAKISGRLHQLASRLAEQQLHLAVLGQFKRGKSTLLNALLGAPVLPVAVTPLTAIPTFIGAGETYHLRTVRLSGESEELPAVNAEALHALLEAHVTEAHNPNNRLGLARVEVSAPSPLLRRGVTLIDTPGVGSTFQHNTETAEAILPECDAAIFVVSLDPPITATELEYLSHIRATAPRIILVVNKIDVVDEVDRKSGVDFLRRVAGDTAGLREAPLFCVSARTALRAKIAGDQEALKASGLPELENYLSAFIAKEKQTALAAAIAGKAETLVGELKFDAESNLATLRMPIKQLSERLDMFDEAARRFEAERNIASDLIAGDRKRVLAELDDDAQQLHHHMLNAMLTEMMEALDRGTHENVIVEGLSERLPRLFQEEFKRFEAKIRKRFTETLSVHQARAEQLIAQVRKTAADLLAIRYMAPAPEETFELKKVPYWVTNKRETLSLVPPGALDGVLPRSVRKQRTYQRFRALIGEVITRNVENLRWALRQNLEAGFATFEGKLDEQLRLTLAATREALRRGIERRSSTIAATDDEIEALTGAVNRLSQIEAKLRALRGAPQASASS